MVTVLRKYVFFPTFPIFFSLFSFLLHIFLFISFLSPPILSYIPIFSFRLQPPPPASKESGECLEREGLSPRRGRYFLVYFNVTFFLCFFLFISLSFKIKSAHRLLIKLYRSSLNCKKFPYFPLFPTSVGTFPNCSVRSSFSRFVFSFKFSSPFQIMVYCMFSSFPKLGIIDTGWLLFLLGLFHILGEVAVRCDPGCRTSGTSRTPAWSGA
jgi:hypothetical protein